MCAMYCPHRKRYPKTIPFELNATDQKVQNQEARSVADGQARAIMTPSSWQVQQHKTRFT